MSSPPRDDRESSEHSRSRALQIAVALGCILLLVVAAVFFLSSGKSSKSKGRAKATSVVSKVELTVGSVKSANGGPPAQLTADAQNLIVKAVADYVRVGLVDPVKTGKPAAERRLDQVFDLGVIGHLKTDRAVLFDEGLPKLDGNFEATAQPLTITALSDGSGAFVLANVTFNYDAKVQVSGGTLTSHRVAYLTLVPGNGAWRITGYDLIVTRSGAGVQSTTPASAAQPTPSAAGKR